LATGIEAFAMLGEPRGFWDLCFGKRKMVLWPESGVVAGKS
jgi:hypothetical protein